MKILLQEEDSETLGEEELEEESTTGDNVEEGEEEV